MELNEELNHSNRLFTPNGEPMSKEGIPCSQLSTHRGKPKGSSSLHTKHPSSIALRLKTSGVDWIIPFGKALMRNDKQLLTLWLKLLPFLIVTAGHRKPPKLKGRTTKAAMRALAELEGKSNG